MIYVTVNRQSIRVWQNVSTGLDCVTRNYTRINGMGHSENLHSLNSLWLDDAITWERVPHYRPFVRVVCLPLLLALVSCWKTVYKPVIAMETQWRYWDVTVMSCAGQCRPPSWILARTRLLPIGSHRQRSSRIIWKTTIIPISTRTQEH